MISNSLQFGMDRVSSLKRADISAVPAIPNILRNTMRGARMKQIDISTRKHPETYALIDDEDYNCLNQHKWTAVEFQRSKTLYATRVNAGRHL